MSTQEKCRPMRTSVIAMLALTTMFSLLFGAIPGQANAATSQPAVKPQPAPTPSTGSVPKPQASQGGVSAAALPLAAAWTVNLTAGSTSLWPTQYTTLTATTNFNVGPTPYWIRIYNQTTGTYLATCGAGTTCSTSVTQGSPTTHRFVALVSYNSASYPPAGQQAISSVVAVNWKSVSVQLSASPTTRPLGSPSVLTATASADVGPSPFYILIFDATTGARVGVCGFGTVCTATVNQWATTTHRYIAYVANYSNTAPPPGIRATSRSVYVTWAPNGYAISLSGPSVTTGSGTFTATTNVNVGPTPYWIQIFNTNGTRLAVCGTGTSCSVNYTPSMLGSNLVAFISSNSAAFLPPNIRANSNVLTTRWLPILTPLSATASVS